MVLILTNAFSMYMCSRVSIIFADLFHLQVASSLSELQCEAGGGGRGVGSVVARTAQRGCLLADDGAWQGAALTTPATHSGDGRAPTSPPASVRPPRGLLGRQK